MMVFLATAYPIVVLRGAFDYDPAAGRFRSSSAGALLFDALVALTPLLVVCMAIPRMDFGGRSQ